MEEALKGNRERENGSAHALDFTRAFPSNSPTGCRARLNVEGFDWEWRGPNQHWQDWAMKAPHSA